MDLATVMPAARRRMAHHGSMIAAMADDRAVIGRVALDPVMPRLRLRGWREA